MNEFYVVWLVGGEEYFFRDKDNARNFLWQTYLNNCSGEEGTEEEARVRAELNEIDMIIGIGTLYVSNFED